jgi:hypothetical protein
MIKLTELLAELSHPIKILALYFITPNGKSVEIDRNDITGNYWAAEYINTKMNVSFNVIHKAKQTLLNNGWVFVKVALMKSESGLNRTTGIQFEIPKGDKINNEVNKALLRLYKRYDANEIIDLNNRTTILPESINESFRDGKGWTVHEGTSHISTIFENGKQLAFELTFRNKIGEEKSKWRQQAASRWTALATKIHNNPELNEIGNTIQKSWEECFMMALESDDMKPYIKPTDGSPIF